MPLLRAQVVLRHQNGLPRDAFSNTFWFEHATATAADAETVGEMVRDFYINPRAGLSNFPLTTVFTDAVADTGHEVRVSPIDEATGDDTRGPGLPPLHVEPFDIIGRPEPQLGMPSEVAVCLSFRNNILTDVPPAQRRGRIYFGPIQNYTQLDESEGVVRPDNAIQTGLRQAGVALRDDARAPQWVVYSRPFAGRGVVVRPNRPDLPALAARPGNAYVVDTIWTDNAFDTQRRRGERATTRTFA